MKSVSEKYAEALFNAAMSLGCVGEVAADLSWIGPLSQQQSAYFRNPLVNVGEKERLIRELLTEGSNPVTLEFLTMLSNRGDWRRLPEAIDRYQSMCDAYLNKVSVDLHVPFEPEQATLDKLKRRFEDEGLIPADAGEVTFRIIMDKSIIGGFIAFCNGRQIDASLRTKLARLRRAER